MTEQLTVDLLSAKNIRTLDIFDFIDFILANEPQITLAQFEQRLADEIFSNSDPKFDITASLVVVTKPNK